MAGNGPFWMGCGAGFSGDRIDAPQSVVAAIAASGRPGAIMFETLAERTLALGHVARRQDPALGYEPLLADLVGPVLPGCVTAGLPIIGNFGNANPPAAAALLQRLADEAGLGTLRIAVVDGDDITAHVSVADLDVWEGDASLSQSLDGLIAANVYLGARPIAEALLAGAQIVVTGRVADPALALGPLAAHFGWAWDDWDRLAAGTLVGHLLECGSQVTGGYFADPGFKDVPNPATIGFPIAEVDEDGGFIITKAPGTGGCVTRRTVTEQILYEVHNPRAYLTPDVVLDVSAVALLSDGPDRIRVQGARGHPAPPSLKATVSFEGDWIGEAEISYAGPNALARARLAATITAQRLDLRGLTHHRRLDLIGTASVFDDDTGTLAAAHAAEPSEVRMRLAVSAPTRRPVDQSLQEVLALLCCGPAGGGGHAVPSAQPRSHVVLPRAAQPRQRDVAVGVVKLHAIAHARAGDKGNRLNVSVIAYHPDLWPLIEAQVMAPRVLALFRHRGATHVERYALPNLHALNFVIDAVLEGGVNASLNLDIHGKTHSFRVLDLEVDCPAELVSRLPSYRSAP